MKLKTLIAELDDPVVSGCPNHDVTGVACDSRKVRAGYVFAAVAGHTLDGSEYVDDALARGAVAVVSEQRTKRDVGCHIRVHDTRVALARLAARFHRHPSRRLKVVGITGTNGKTTTACVVRDMLNAAKLTPGVVGTIQYEIGTRRIPAGRTTPDAAELQRLFADMLQTGCRSVVMEVSSHALDQRRTLGTAFDVAVFTNLTRDHLDYHGTMDAYFEAKARLFRELDGNGKDSVALVHVDSEWGRRMLGEVPDTVSRLTYGFRPQADIRAVDVSVAAEGSRFHLTSPWGSADVRIGLLGRYNVSNAMASVGAATVAGVPFETALAVLSEAEPAPGRLEPVANDRGYHVYVDYAHTDDALENVLTTLREVTAGRLIVVMGCGGSRDRTKRPAMGRVASRLADFSIVTSDNPRKEDPEKIIDEIRPGFESASRYAAISDRRAAIAAAIAEAAENDTVLIAGKGHETFQEFADRTVPFDDRAVAREVLEEPS